MTSNGFRDLGPLLYMLQADMGSKQNPDQA